MDWTLPPPPPAYELRLDAPLPLPDDRPGTARTSRAEKYERRWKKARTWSGVSLGLVGAGAALEAYAAASLFLPELDDGTAPILAGTYGGLLLYGGATGVFIAEAVGSRGLVERPGPWGLVVSGVGVIVTFGGAIQAIQDGSDESVLVLLSGPMLVGVGALTQYALADGAERSGFRAAIVPTGTGAAFVGTF